MPQEVGENSLLDASSAATPGDADFGQKATVAVELVEVGHLRSQYVLKGLSLLADHLSGLRRAGDHLVCLVLAEVPGARTEERSF